MPATIGGNGQALRHALDMWDRRGSAVKATNRSGLLPRIEDILAAQILLDLHYGVTLSAGT